MPSKNSNTALKLLLENLLNHADWDAYLGVDPVGIVHDFQRDQQGVVALIVSTLAYGRVDLLRSAATDLLDRLGDRPADRIVSSTTDELAEFVSGFSYRMTSATDVLDLLAGVQAGLRKHGSLEALYNATEGDHLTKSIGFVAALRRGRLRPELARGFRYLLPSPADGSTTKRLHLFFRWVGRGPDAVDLGLWDSLSPHDLIMPLDTHTSRICRYIGLTSRKSNDLKAALQVTAALTRIDEADPLRFDFAICHLGISGGCIHERSEQHCPNCPLDGVCTLL